MRVLRWALLVLAPLAVDAPALSGPFVFDDRLAILDNPSFDPPLTLARVLDQPSDIPLSIGLDAALGGREPLGFHVTNALLHGLCALLVFALVRVSLRAPRLAERFAAAADGLAFATALLFALHPLASEVVCYISARTESLVALFYLAALYCAARARESLRPYGWVAAAVASSCLGMASKEVMVTAPFVAALHDAVLWGRAATPRRGVRVWLYAGLFASLGVLAALVAAAPRGESAGFAHWLTPAVYLANQCRLLPHYLRLVVAPWPLRLDYGLPQPLALGDVWPWALGLVSLLALSLYALRRWPAAGLVGVACFAVLAPSSSFVPIASEVGAERRMDLALAFLLALGVCGAWWCLARLGARRLAPALVALAALGLALASHARSRDYASELALWRHEVAVAPENARAHYNLAQSLLRAGEGTEAAEERARSAGLELAYYAAILPFQPDPVRARVDLGALHEVSADPAGAESLYRQVLQQAPDDPYALRRLASLLLRRDPPSETAVAEALRLARHAVEVTRQRDGLALETLARAQLLSGDRAAAEQALRAALATDPASLSARQQERIRESLAELGAAP
jgi:hypothetical protein